MMAEHQGSSPKYNVSTVEAAVLEIAAELHPERLSTCKLLLKVVGDPEDEKEIETGAEAIRSLQEVGLFTRRDDETVELTAAAIRAVALLT